MRILALFIVMLLMGCGVGKNSFSPNKKYSPQQIQKDYSIYQTMLEESHPGLYWYTSKDSMNEYFRKGAEQLKDSMTEPQFRKVLTWVTAKINCGHTSVRSSKMFSKYLDTVRTKIFPLSIKVWDDTMTVAANLNSRDSILKRGTILKKINDKPVKELVDTMFNYISTDGYNRTHKYQALSNRGYFGSLYTALFGLSEKYKVEYIDSSGQTKSVITPAYNLATDTFNRIIIRPITSVPHPSKKERKQQQMSSVRQLKIDSANHTAFMDLSSFGRGYHLKKFFRVSFRALKKNRTGYLIIDVRGNGGGSISNSTIISRYLTDHPFKIGDSIYAIRKKSTYGHYIQNNFFNRFFITLVTKKRADGHYHFGYFERHYFKQKKHNHFNGNVYVLIGGNSFSATTLFASSIIKQDNVIVVGEETGGGAYGNTAWLIPDVALPETGVRFRLPLFRLVIDKNYPKTGKGVQPEVEVKPTVDAIRRGADFKLDKVMEMIKSDKSERLKDNNLPTQK
jgi:C-terminal processing protease CtpA/Prc